MVAAMLAAFSVGVWLSALNVAYRDVQYVVPFLIQAWLFVTPVAYPTDLGPRATCDGSPDSTRCRGSIDFGPLGAAGQRASPLAAWS